MSKPGPPKQRINKVTTRIGDDGQTRLATSRTVPKTHSYIRALGSIDDLNCQIGLLLAHLQDTQANSEFLRQIQQSLFDLGALLAMEGDYSAPTPEDIATLEQQTQDLTAQLPPLQEFVIPGGTVTTAQVHVCRSRCRIAELDVWHAVSEQAKLKPAALYLNRLSDYFFSLARLLTRQDDEPQWRGPRS